MEIPVFQMGSFSRSGETLMLRCLQAHPRIEVVHQIREPDTPEDFALFRQLQRQGKASIPLDHPKLAHRDLDPEKILVLKNAVWTHKAPWQGFVLARNPLSVVNSTRFNPDAETANQILVRWARGIDPLMVPHIERLDNITALCTLITRKMMSYIGSGNPVVHYERFVEAPEAMLRKIVAHLGLDWDDRVLRSHEDYEEGEIGHGQIKLARPIHRGSQNSWLKLPEEAREMVYAFCAPVFAAYGYRYDGESLEIDESFDDGFATDAANSPDLALHS